MPLFEQMEGGPTNGQCSVCQHFDRDAIDDELRTALRTVGRHKGFGTIARKYNLPYPHLIWHAGRLTKRVRYRWKGRVRYRRELVAGHLGSVPAAPIVHWPRKYPCWRNEIDMTQILPERPSRGGERKSLLPPPGLPSLKV